MQIVDLIIPAFSALAALAVLNEYYAHRARKRYIAALKDVDESLETLRILASKVVDAEFDGLYNMDPQEAEIQMIVAQALEEEAEES